MTGQLIQLTFNDLEDLLTRLKGNNGLNKFIEKTSLKYFNIVWVFYRFSSSILIEKLIKIFHKRKFL